MVCIIDDREDVWHFSPNLVHVKPYRFFQGTADINAPPGLSKTEEDDKPMTHKVRRVSQSGMESTDSTSEEITKLEKESPKTDSKSELKSKPVNEIADTDNKTEESKPGNEKDQTGRKAEEKQKHVNELAENDSKMKDHSKQEAETAGIDSKMEGIKDDTNEGDSDDNKLLINEGNSDGDAKDRSDANQEISSKEKVKEEKSSDNSKQAKESDQQQQNKNETDVKQKTPETETKLNEDFIEWDDEDDYLFYLEEILKTIHSTFYDFYDQIKRNETEGIDVKDLDKPSLKNIIPYMRKKVLKGCNIVFSGVIPTNMNPEKSRAYVVAKALGATVQQDFLYKENEKDPTNYTTHLVAAKHGTTKVRTALKLKCIKIVNIDWLWCCTERWEKVEEILFPLAELDNGSGRDSPDPQKMKKELKRKVGKTEIGNSQSKKRQKVAPTGNGEGDENDLNAEIDTEQETPPTAMAETVDSSKPEAFSMSYNPILAFSDDDLAYMDKEVEDEMDDEFNESSEDENSRDVRIRTSVLKSEHLADLDVSESEESLSGDTPRGWGLKKLSPRSSSDEELKISNSPVREEVGPEYESETDQDKFEKIMDAFGPETEVSDNEEYQESVGSVDDEIAEAVIKEFLS
ncbi:hypothetical protein DPMN_179847 [Dreissena polymorpha]|uniref:RNA polymerase II subunit A C-terminal domain phosphatase n=3 Tax=Dreissena polymorpha TaxID=45954 RepID=A0A9D4EF77_DREPO|nr:hypothetical protein DPMN_179847 [Dreissena polymorpha]